MTKTLMAFLSGILFGTGISLSGMANPAKVVNFFDIAGAWDPSLMFVMGGALVVAFVGYRLVFRMPKPFMESTFHVPTNRVIDRKLLGGAAIFGIGWGIAGFCPGGALPVVGTLNADVLVFMGALLVGVLATTTISAQLAKQGE